MKRLISLVMAGALVAAVGIAHPPAVMAQAGGAQEGTQEGIYTKEQADQLARELGHDDADDAVASGLLAQREGGYVLTGRGLAAARDAGLLMSPALIPLGVGLAVAIVGIGLIVILDDSRARDDGPDGTDTSTTTTTGTGGT